MKRNWLINVLISGVMSTIFYMFVSVTFSEDLSKDTLVIITTMIYLFGIFYLKD